MTASVRVMSKVLYTAFNYYYFQILFMVSFCPNFLFFFPFTVIRRRLESKFDSHANYSLHHFIFSGR